ncbi:MAG: hypothetical protein VKK99_03050 [Cyanobacteriota bacterium]|nr:hypothetical protein [Cyanobacteriota bacterium]
MLSKPSEIRACGRRGWVLAGAVAALIVPLWTAQVALAGTPTPDPAPEEGSPGSMPPPPPDLVVLIDKVGVKGRYRLGVFDRQPDPNQPQVWRLKLWEQTLDRLFVSTDVLNCSTTQPMRITGGSGEGNGRLILRDLNPGGPITPANRLDHQIWWAACFPGQAGKDPATLGPEARRLGFSGTLVERELVVPGSRRR